MRTDIPFSQEGLINAVAKKSILSKKQIIYFLINLFLLCNLLIHSIIPPSYSAYVYIVYLPIILFAILIDTNYLFKFRKEYLYLYLFLIFHLLLLFVYFVKHDFETIKNLSSLLLAYIGLYSLSVLAKKYLNISELLPYLFLSFVYFLIIGIIVSILLTASQYQYAPPYFPWEAIGSDLRFLILRGSTDHNVVGHSVAMWLMAFSIIYLTAVKNRINIFLKWLSVLLLVVLLIETESRVALLMVLLMGVVLVLDKAKRVRPLYYFALLMGVFYYYYSAINPDVASIISDAVYNIQSHISDVRLYGSSGTHTVFTGRDVLNQVLYDESFISPWIGQGDSNILLSYGVTTSGDFAYYYEHAAGNVESILRILVKYGWVYYVLLFLVIIYPLLVHINKQDNWSLFAMFFGVLGITAMNASLFEQMLGISSIFMFLLLLISIPNKSDSA